MAHQVLLALPARQAALGGGGACTLGSLSVAGRGLAMLRSPRQKEEQGPGSESFSGCVTSGALEGPLNSESQIPQLKNGGTNAYSLGEW